MKKLVALILVAGLAAQGLAGPALAAERPNEIPAVQAQTPAGSQATPSRAENCLAELAGGLRQGRAKAGKIGAICGGASLAGGIVMIAADNDGSDSLDSAGIILAALGGTLLVVSAFILSVPSGPEKELTRVKAIDDAARREEAAAAALADLSKRGKRSRMIMGGVGSAAAVATSLAINPNSGEEVYILAGVLAGLGIASFLVKSPEEKAYSAFTAGSRMKPTPELVIGLAPRGGIQVGFHLSF